MQAIQCESVGVQGEIRVKDQEIAALQRRYVDYLANDKDENNGILIMAMSNEEAEYTYISICGQHRYGKHKTRALLVSNQNSNLFSDGDTPHVTITYHFLQEQEGFFPPKFAA